MSTTIEWTQRPGTKGETWNPVVGCTKVSAGCKFCYAKRIHDNRHKAKERIHLLPSSFVFGLLQPSTQSIIQ